MTIFYTCCISNNLVVFIIKSSKNTDCYYHCYEVGCSWNWWIEIDIAVVEDSRVDVSIYPHMRLQAGIIEWSI